MVIITILVVLFFLSQSGQEKKWKDVHEVQEFLKRCPDVPVSPEEAHTGDWAVW